jgi:hypothetical protein
VTASRRETLTGAAILLLLVLVTFAQFVFGDKTIQDSSVAAGSLYTTGSRSPVDVHWSASRGLDPGAGAWQIEPWFALEHHTIFDEHEPPLWNPYSGMGMPLAANMQSQPYSPFAWIPIALPNAYAYNIFIILRLYAAGLFAFLFLRQFFGLWPSLAGGITLTYAGFYMLYITMPELSVEVVTAGALYALERMLRAPSRRSGAVLAAFIGGGILGGMPEATALALPLIYAYAVVRIAGDPVLRASAKRIALCLAGATAGGLGLAAIAILPFFSYAHDSLNVHPNGAGIGLGHDQYSDATLALYLAPLMQGPPWNLIFNNFSGGAGLRGFTLAGATFFAMLAACSLMWDAIRRRGVDVPAAFFTVASAIFLMKRFGHPLVNWLGGLPVVDRVEWTKYEEANVACCVAILVGIGVARIVERRAELPPIVFAAALPACVVLGGLWYDWSAFQALTTHRYIFEFSILAALGFMAAATIIAAGALGTRVRGAALGIAACAVVFLEPLLVWIVPLYYIADPQPPRAHSAYLGAPYIAYVQQHDRDGGRFFSQDGVLVPNWSTAFGIADLREVDALVPDRLLPFVRAFVPSDMAANVASRFDGAGHLDYYDPLAQRLFTLTSLQFAGLSDAMPPPQAVITDAYFTYVGRQVPVVTAGTYVIGGDARHGLFMHPALPDHPRTQFSFPLHVAPQTRDLAFAIGLLPAVWASTVCGDGVTFAIDVATSGSTTRVFTRYIDPKHDVRLRRWNEARVSLTPFRNRDINLVLSTAPGPSGSNCADWAVWGSMRTEPAVTIANPWTPAFTDPSVHLYSYRWPLPRVSIYHRVIAVTDQAAAIARVADTNLDVRKIAVVEGANPALRPFLSGPADDVTSGTIDRYTSNTVDARVDVREPSFVMLNDAAYLGWNAYVDGVRTPIYNTDGLFRGIIVPAGSHTIAFRYEPLSFTIGATITIIALLGIILALILPGMRKQAAGRKAPQ